MWCVYEILTVWEINMHFLLHFMEAGEQNKIFYPFRAMFLTNKTYILMEDRGSVYTYSITCHLTFLTICCQGNTCIKIRSSVSSIWSCSKYVFTFFKFRYSNTSKNYNIRLNSFLLLFLLFCLCVQKRSNKNWKRFLLFSKQYC